MTGSEHLQDGIELIPEEMGKIFVPGPHNRRPQRGEQPALGAWGLERLARQGIPLAALAGEQHLHEPVLAAAEQQAVAIQIGPTAHQFIGAIAQLELKALAPKNPLLVAADGAGMDPAIQDLEVHRRLVRRGRASRCCRHLPGADRCLLEAGCRQGLAEALERRRLGQGFEGWRRGPQGSGLVEGLAGPALATGRTALVGVHHEGHRPPQPGFGIPGLAGGSC